MTKLRTLATTLAAVLATALAGPVPGAAFVDVLDTPARMSALAASSFLQGVSRAGDRLVAVGPRGHVVVSPDGGKSWKQSPVPVSSDLTAVYFVDPRQGWAVGHDGVVLHTRDGGTSWTLQLDGRQANKLLVAAMERKAAAEPASDAAKALLAEAKRYLEQGPDKPFLGVWFADERTGWIVGAYNQIFRTTDGGTTWEPWFDRTDNPKFFNLYAIGPAAGGLYVAGEGGLVLKLDPAGQRFAALAVPYNGSFFGVTGAQDAVLVFGLRGNAFRSDDGGVKWTKVDTGLPATIVAATGLPQGTTLLGDVGGRLAATADGGRTFTSVPLKQAMPVTAIADAGDGRIALTGPRGVTVTEVAAR